VPSEVLGPDQGGPYSECFVDRYISSGTLRSLTAKVQYFKLLTRSVILKCKIKFLTGYNLDTQLICCMQISTLDKVSKVFSFISMLVWFISFYHDLLQSTNKKNKILKTVYRAECTLFFSDLNNREQWRRTESSHPCSLFCDICHKVTVCDTWVTTVLSAQSFDVK